MTDSRVRRSAFTASELRLIAPAPAPDNPPLMIGDYCVLNSGGPDCLVVEADDANVVIAWPRSDGAAEHALPRACVRRKR